MVEPTDPGSYFLRGGGPKTPIDQNRILLSIQRLEKTGGAEVDLAPLINIAIDSVKSVSNGEASADGSALHQVESLLLLLRQKKIDPAKALFDALDSSVKDKLRECCPDVEHSIENLLCYRNTEGLNLLEAVLVSLYEGDTSFSKMHEEDFTKQDIDVEYDCIEKTYQELAKNLSGSVLQRPEILSRIDDERFRIAIAKRCVQQWGLVAAEHIQNFGIKNEAALIEIAKLCMKPFWIGKFWAIQGIAEYIQNFGITDRAALIEIAKLCAEQDPWNTAKHIQNFGIKDEAVLIEIAKLCAKTAWRTVEHIQNFGIRNEAALIEIVKLCAQQNVEGTRGCIQHLGLEDARQIRDLEEYCICLNILQINSIDKRDQDMLIDKMSMILEAYSETKIPADSTALSKEAKAQTLFSGSRFKGWDKRPLSLILARKMSRMILAIQCFDGFVDVDTWNVLCEFADLRSPRITRYCLTAITILQINGAWGRYAKFYKDWPQFLSVLPLINWQERALEPKPDISEIIRTIQGLKKFFKDGSKMERWLSICNGLDSIPFSPNEKIDILGKIISGIPGKKADQMKEIDKRINAIEAIFAMKQELKLQECADFSRLGEVVVASLNEIEGLNLSDVEDCVDKWNEKILSTRAPDALLIYLGALQSVGDPRLIAVYTKLIKDILSGVEREARYDASKSPHLQTVSTANPTLWADWQKSIKPEKVALSAKEEGAFSLKEYLRGKMDDGHLGGFETLKRYLREGGIEELKEERDDVQTQLINLCEDPSLTKEGMVNALERILRDRRGEFHGLELLNDLQALVQLLGKARATGPKLTIVDTDDWMDLLMCGTEVLGSCQRIDGSPGLNKGLLAYIVDGKNRMLAIKNAEGKIVARSLFRLLFDKVEGRPVLYQDRFYPEPCPLEHVEVLQEFAKKRARDLKCPLYDSRGPASRGHEIVSLGSPAPYEYEDATGGVTDGKFTITNPHLVLSPSE